MPIKTSTDNVKLCHQNRPPSSRILLLVISVPLVLSTLLYLGSPSHYALWNQAFQMKRITKNVSLFQETITMVATRDERPAERWTSSNTTVNATAVLVNASSSWIPSAPVAPGVSALAYAPKTGNQPPWFTSRRGVHNDIPLDMIVIPGGKVPVLWCPNAKAGTSTIYGALEPLIPHRCYKHCRHSAWRHFQRDPLVRDHIVGQTAISFSVVRNPWDRIRSAYDNKLATGKIQRDGVRTFADFVQYIHRHRHNDTLIDPHWESYSRRCYTSPDPDQTNHSFEYTHIFRMEDDFMHQVNAVFAKAGIPLAATEARNVAPNIAHSLQNRIDYYTRAAHEGNMTLEDLNRLVRETFRGDIAAWNYSFRVYNQ